jgi:eukaryotic-like serine/threonine-protein kinase
MNATRWKQIDDLFDAALEVSKETRLNFVALHAGDDHDLRDKVVELLQAQGDSVHFLGDSAMRAAANAMAAADTEVIPLAFVNKRIATYRIERLIGEGGMGQVYLAFDEKLKRRVALKLLPPEYATNDERVKRFELEARAVSILNHPGIVTIYDVGNFEGVSYIATEFVEGRTVRDLIGGKFKLRNIILNAIQICDALSAAHYAGIIHRDIKPDNIMIRKDGYAKILDFGLAKLTAPGARMLPDLAATSHGTIVGTPAYMSPAQISNDAIDRRTDLWSCGVVLYEFLSGENPFKGSNRQETFQNILTRQVPPCSSLNPEVPPEIDGILDKLLQKDAAKGYQSASELRADLKRLKREIDSSRSSAVSSPGRGNLVRPAAGRPRYAYSGLAILFVAFAAATAYFTAVRTGDAPSGVDWADAKSIQLTNQSGTEYFPSLSPDGTHVVYAAVEDGNFDIFVQRVDEGRRRNLTPDSNASDTQPAFSPTGDLIAFRSEREPKGIYLMGPAGENLRHISSEGFHPSWSPDGRYLVASTFGRDQPTTRATGPQKLVVIDALTGATRTVLDAEATFPVWSPNGHRIAYWFYTGTYGRRDIATIPADGGEPVVVAQGFAVSNWNPVWSPDGKFLYFVSSRGGNMNFWRVAIDEVTGKVIADPEPVPSHSTFSRHLTFSKDGKRMAYVKTDNRANVQGVVMDPKALTTVGEPFWITQGDREVSRAELSPDGTQFVMRLIRRTQDDIVTVSRDGKEWHDVTNDEPFDRYVRWAPDGKTIAFSSDREGGNQVWIAKSDGSGMYQFTFDSDPEIRTGFPVWSPDGKRLSVFSDQRTMIYDISATSEAQQPFIMPASANADRMVVWDWSPDGTKLAGVIAKGAARHVGYYSLLSGEYVVVVSDNGSVPSWLPDSRHLVFSDAGTVFIADTESGSVRKLFQNELVNIRSPFVSRDGTLLYYTAANEESDIWMLDLHNR